MSRIGSKGTPYTGYTPESRPPESKDSDFTESKIPRSDDYLDLPERPILQRKAEKSEEQELSEDQLGILTQLHKKKEHQVFSESLRSNVTSMEQLGQLRNKLPSRLSDEFQSTLLHHAAVLSMNDAVNTLMDFNLPVRERYNALAVFMSAPNQAHCPVKATMAVRAENFTEKLNFSGASIDSLIEKMTIEALGRIDAQMRSLAQDLLDTTHLTHEDQISLKQQLQQQHIFLVEAMERAMITAEGA